MSEQSVPKAPPPSPAAKPVAPPPVAPPSPKDGEPATVESMRALIRSVLEESATRQALVSGSVTEVRTHVLGSLLNDPEFLADVLRAVSLRKPSGPAAEPKKAPRIGYQVVRLNGDQTPELLQDKYPVTPPKDGEARTEPNSGKLRDASVFTAPFTPADGAERRIPPGGTMLAETGLRVFVPKGYAAIVSTPLANGKPGLSVPSLYVDSRAEGELVIPIRNHSDKVVMTLYPGQHAFTLRLVECPEADVVADRGASPLG